MYGVRSADDFEILRRRVARAIRLKQPITFTYLETKKDPQNANRRMKDQFEVTIRTVEPFGEILPNVDGKLYFRSLDRDTEEYRSWRLDRVITYSTHHSRQVVPIPVTT
jgi:predicted DNA-binding transcriptional regulator YafY